MFHVDSIKNECFVDDVAALVIEYNTSPRVCQNLLGKSCVLPTSKKLCKVKKEFISNSLS
jgi:hypothetical protein